MSFLTIKYTPNGTDANEIHLAGNDMNVRYFQNFNLYQNNMGLITYQELDVTSWLWPNYIFELNSCSPDLPIFTLEDKYSIKLAENNQINYTFTAYEQCRDSRFLFRICTDIPKDNVACVTPPWVSFNQTSGNFTIDTSKISSVANIKMIFQSQLIGFSFNDINLSYLMSTNSSMFNFENDNWALNNTQNDWYVISGKMKTFSLSFYDKENDTIYLKLIDSKNLDVFIQKRNSSTFSLMAMWNDISISHSTIKLKYTDKYHQDDQFWIEADITVNVFPTEPPQFASNPNNIIVNLWVKNQYVYDLPEISDPDSTTFSVSLNDNSLNWIKIQESNVVNTQYQKFYVGNLNKKKIFLIRKF